MAKTNTKIKTKETVVQEVPMVQPPETTSEPINERKNVVEMSMVEWDDICKSRGFKTKSSMIRYLWAEGYTRSAIAKFLGIIYQHVRNVLVQEPKKPSTLAQNTAATAASAEGPTNNAE